MSQQRVTEYQVREGEAIYIRNLALHPSKPMRKLPTSRWQRAWLVIRGYELYGD